MNKKWEYYDIDENRINKIAKKFSISKLGDRIPKGGRTAWRSEPVST